MEKRKQERAVIVAKWGEGGRKRGGLYALLGPEKEQA